MPQGFVITGDCLMEMTLCRADGSQIVEGVNTPRLPLQSLAEQRGCVVQAILLSEGDALLYAGTSK